MSVNQQNGIHTSLADLPLAAPLDTVQQQYSVEFTSPDSRTIR